MPKTMKRPPVMLTVAGSDPSGGAGIQADLRTATILGVYAMAVPTALTVQNTLGVQSVHPVGASLVAAQLEAVLADIKPDAVKVGMIPDAASVEAIASAIERFKLENVVLDPVMASTSGRVLADSEAIEAMKARLFPLTTLLTPNIPEASSLAGIGISSKEEMVLAAKRIRELHRTRSVLLKGGHLIDPAGYATDLLLTHAPNEDERVVEFRNPFVDTKNTHGTGCTLSSAIAAQLACGLPLEEAVRRAEAYLHAALVAGAGFELGQGHGPLGMAGSWLLGEAGGLFQEL